MDTSILLIFVSLALFLILSVPIGIAIGLSVAVGIVFGGLILAQSFGASWPMPVALLILAGVLIVNEGK